MTIGSFNSALDFIPSNGQHTENDIVNLFLNIIKDYGNNNNNNL